MNFLQAILKIFGPQSFDLPQGEAPMARFLGQHHATPARKERRNLVARYGRRQAIKRIKWDRWANRQQPINADRILDEISVR